LTETASLAGHGAVVVGAASSMGAAIARALHEAGADVALADLRVDALARAASELGPGPGRVIHRVTDATRSAEVEALVAHAHEVFGRLDVMVNLAGVIHDALVVDTDEAALDRVLAVNLKGIWFGCQAAARVMSQQGSGSIVNMASSAAFTATPMLGAYAASKAGVVALTRVLAAEVGRHGVRVNAVAPGYVEGGMTHRHVLRPDGSVDEARLAELREQVRRRNPLRVTGEPEDVAGVVLFLASPASRYLTGQVLHPNGGAYMP